MDTHLNPFLLNDYQQLAARTAKAMPTLELDLTHAALGMTTETGEFADVVKRALIYERPLEEGHLQNMKEELGDLMWYVALAATKLNIPLSEICADNIAKLARRYPEKYTNQAALARADKVEGSGA